MTAALPSLSALGRRLPGKRMQPQNAGTLADPDPSFVTAVLGALSSSGVRVNQAAAMGVPTVFACVGLLAKIIATLPLKLYRRTSVRGREGKEEVANHPVAELLRRPNPEMTSADVRGALGANFALRQNAYAMIVRDRLQRPRQLWPLHCSRVTPYRTPGGELRYRVAAETSTETRQPARDVPFSDILDIRGLSFNGIVGMGVLPSVREAIGLAIALDDNAARFFGNGSRPGLLLTTDAKLTPEQIKAIVEQIAKEYQGPANAQKTMVLSGGLKTAANPTAGNDASQFDESRARQAVAICQVFGVPPHKVGILDRATFSNIEHQQIQFGNDTIAPICTQWEQAMDGALLSEEERAAGLYIKHDLKALMRGDTKSRMDSYATQIQNGMLSPNEARGLEDMEPREGGDVWFQPLNVTPVGPDAALANPQANPAPTPAPTNRINGHHHDPILS